ncbi:ABC transporter substrate-binding protein [Paracoccus versutus]|jgi:putative spermidine/putrescine transport system substrate-binding protein|uniref:Spermidine/putrescine transport system substrate-binding protein n=1 Tax=Paracoccus versutus TaxID=34007 RepID=A0A099FM22_PARVE|nr:MULTISPECIES: ABC transporter substrate-binding protein [Paracoccus]KGJ11740.1 spermidine/putrescine ABC transporter substrate-binding protein [Paracoccus versutus]MBT0779618.1 ABC transporter substrate-binding protein [Paracoccus sp. pheM1]MCJ1899124.1 ABC transporter substrate-binding protein [Paracoccus versutus]MDF3903533.1 ABC transporter substrate-binding protein [Paracoccus sp. AS002]RDD73406.1 ABC transporter substrate-binding protein [Paracoccus versutus]
MKTTLILTSALCSLGLAAQAQNKEVNVVSWGGAYERSQVEAYNIPFAEQTGIKVNMLAADNPATPLKAQVEAGNITGDVFDIEVSDAIRLCDEGALVEIDPAILPPAPDGTPATEDFIPGALQECAVANIFWGTVIAFDSTKFDGEKPSTAADFFDTAKFPGKRGLPKNPKRTLYLALIADGVAPDQIYEVLGTPEGVDQAFAKLDTIKGDVVWWEAGAQPVQLLADGEVVMATGYNGRFFDAMVGEGKPFEIIWDGQYMDMDMFAIPKGSPNPEAALEYLKFATATEQLANQAKYIAYGPSRKSSAALVGLFQDGKTEMAPHMPTSEEHMKTAVMDDPEFWADHSAELAERFNGWLAAN